jgi:L-ascorbate metabolism protein UlaG (beta-lactamase superfamily)
MPESAVTLRWLGVGGFELVAGGRVLLVDPYLTRISFLRQWVGKLRPDVELLARLLPRCDAILITHAHYDHLMDAPVLALATGAHVYGSPNTCALLSALGVPEERVHRVSPGDAIAREGFAVDVSEGRHPALPAFRPGALPRRLCPPLPARAYRMDVNLCFRIRAGGLRVLTDPGMVPEGPADSDVLLLAPHLAEPVIRGVLRAVRPRLVLPTHWDDMWRALGKPLRPAMTLPRAGSPVARRIDVRRFSGIVEGSDERPRVLVPERLQPYDLGALLG